jgi:glycerol-3-phosphate acyltransferase PlsY
VWLGGFKGGKGVATAAGVLMGFEPLLGAATLATWVIIAWFFRYSSLAAIVAAAFAPFFYLLVWGGGPLVLSIAVMSLLLVWRHSANIRKLLDGTEGKLGQKVSAHATTVTAQHPHPPHHPPHSRKGRH